MKHCGAIVWEKVMGQCKLCDKCGKVQLNSWNNNKKKRKRSFQPNAHYIRTYWTDVAPSPLSCVHFFPSSVVTGSGLVCHGFFKISRKNGLAGIKPKIWHPNITSAFKPHVTSPTLFLVFSSGGMGCRAGVRCLWRRLFISQQNVATCQQFSMF